MPEPPTLPPGTVLLLVRHGETQWNLDGRIQGQLDVPLTERGRTQARRVAARLVPEVPAAVIASDLARASETASPLASALGAPLVLEPRLREAHFGAFQGLTHPELRQRFPEAYDRWRADAVSHRPPGGETLEELRERCLAAVLDHAQRAPGRRLVFITHGGPIRVLLCALLGLPLRCYPALRSENASLARLEYGSRGAMLAAVNDTCHLRAVNLDSRHAGWEEQ
jgi:broad specificity phosphatase PhoE